MGNARETMYGRELQLVYVMPEGVIRMHPETWKAIRPFYRKNEVKVQVMNQTPNSMGNTESKFDALLRRKPKTDDEFVLVMAMLRVSGLPEYSHQTVPQIYEELLNVAKNSSEYLEQKESIAVGQRFLDALAKASTPEERQKVWITDFTVKENQ
jgi:hypothetical protein